MIENCSKCVESSIARMIDSILIEARHHDGFKWIWKLDLYFRLHDKYILSKLVKILNYQLFMFGHVISFQKCIIQWLNYETDQTVLFWDILWQENFVYMNCETYLASKCAPKPPWPTGFEKSKIHWPNLEKLQFFLIFQENHWKSGKNASILLHSNYNFSRLG